MGLELNGDAVADRMRDIKSRFPSEEAFLGVLKKEGTSFDDFQEKVRDQLLIKAFVGREVTSKVVVTPREIEAYYKANEKSFSEEENVHLFHIMIRRDPENGLLSQETSRQILIKLPNVIPR